MPGALVRRWRSGLAAGLLALGLVAAAPTARTIRPGENLALQIPAGGSESFSVPLRADRPVRIVADQVGIDVALELMTESGGRIEVVADRSSGLEILVAIVPRAGNYRLELSAASEKLPAGEVALRVEELADSDQVHAAARRHLEARRVGALGKERYRDARREFEAARDAWAAAGDEIMTAYTLQEIGNFSLLLPEPVAARLAYAEAARRFAAAGRTADQALAQYGVGGALHRQGDVAGACAQWKATFPLEGKLTPVDRLTLRYDYAADIKETGEYDVALPIIEQAIGEYRELGLLANELSAQAELGSIHLMRRDTVQALDALTRGVARSRETGRPDMEARFLQRLAVLDWEIGDHDAAADQATRALALFRQAGNRVAEGAVLVLLGDVLRKRGDAAGAEANYRQALDLFRGAGSQAGEARALSRLGLLLSTRGESARAVEFLERAIEFNRKQGSRQGEINSLLNLGRVRAAAGDRAEARRVLNQVLALTRESGGGFAEEDALGELALIDVAEGAYDRALAALDEILEQAEARQRKALVPGLQVSLTGDAQPWYAARTDLLMRRHQAAPRAGWDARALESAERARSRVLLGMLAESRFDLREGVDPDRLARYREAQVRLAEAATDAARLEASQAVQAIEAEIRKANPAYAALTLPVPPTLEVLRRRVLDDDTVLLEYAAGVKRGWLFAVSREGLVTAEIPDSDTIDAAAERLYATLAARPTAVARPAGAAAGAAAAGNASAESAALSAMVLGPIADRLAGPWKGRRLVIVPSSGLAPIPFGTLPLPGAASGRRLIDDHEIVGLPSATVIAVLRQANARRASAARGIALIGDPVFSADDPRVRGVDAGAPAVAARGVDRGGPAAAPASLPAAASTYPRLPFSREEVRSIAALLPGGGALEALDFGATRSLATGGALSGYRIVHFATHGVIDTAHPDLSGLVLSLVDEAGRPQDGFLRLQEIYNLRLDADLVVLSACRSALGRRIAGEGLIGLTRGFIHAGAPRVVASLWQVDDSATSELMTRFYRGMIADGLRPAAALRRAQIAMKGDPRWAAPFYWAGFTLEGEWR